MTGFLIFIGVLIGIGFLICALGTMADNATLRRGHCAKPWLTVWHEASNYGPYHELVCQRCGATRKLNWYFNSKLARKLQFEGLPAGRS